MTKDHAKAVDTFVIHSDANNDLSAFLIFCGIFGSVPCYYLFNFLILRNVNFDWRFGGVIGLLMVVGGIMLRMHSHKSFVVSQKGEGGCVDVCDGYFHKAVRYAYVNKPSVQLNVISVDYRRTQADCWQVTLVDGRCLYMLDRRIESLQESRALAEFLAKALNCILSIQTSNGTYVDVAPDDLDLPYYRRAKKYPALLGPHPHRPDPCPVNITAVDGGLGRIYSWGIAASGFLADSISVFIVALAFGALPVFGDVGSHYSLWQSAQKSGSYLYFIWVLAIFAFVMFFLLGYRSQIAVLSERVNCCCQIWGFKLWKRSMLVDDLEEISARSCSGGTRIQLVSDELVASLRLANLECANYLVSDIQYHISAIKS